MRLPADIGKKAKNVCEHGHICYCSLLSTVIPGQLGQQCRRQQSLNGIQGDQGLGARGSARGSSSWLLLDLKCLTWRQGTTASKNMLSFQGAGFLSSYDDGHSLYGSAFHLNEHNITWHSPLQRLPAYSC